MVTKTYKWCEEIYNRAKASIPTLTSKSSKYWFIIRDSNLNKNIVYIGRSANKVRLLFTTLPVEVDYELSPAPGSWHTSKFTVDSEEKIEKAADLVVKAYYFGISQTKKIKKIKGIQHEILRRKYPHGESEAHRRLKEWIAENFWFLGLQNVIQVEIEAHKFPSGDLPDIVFHHSDGKYSVVEVETTDALPGAFQALKYKYLLIAEKGLPLNTTQVEAFLVAWKIPDNVREFCERYGIRCLEKKI